MAMKLMSKRSHFRRGILYNLILFLGMLLVFIIGCNVGQYAISVPDLVSTVFGHGTSQMELVLFEYRLPRLCLSILVGIGMGMAGVIMQDLLHNNLASPGTLGVSGGSGLFVTIYVAALKTSGSSPILLPVLALVGGILSAVLIFLLGTKKKQELDPTRLIMTGVAMGSAYGAVSTFMMLILDQSQLEFLQRWQSGELWGTQWRYIIIFLLWLIVFGGAGYYRAHTLNVINLGYDIAKGLGINVSRQFVFLSFSAVAVSSASVAFGGNLFFLGLIGPHIARRLVGTDARYLIPASGFVAAIIIMGADILIHGWSLLANIPTGIIVSVLSVPYFLYLLMKS